MGDLNQIFYIGIGIGLIGIYIGVMVSDSYGIYALVFGVVLAGIGFFVAVYSSDISRYLVSV